MVGKGVKLLFCVGGLLVAGCAKTEHRNIFDPKYDQGAGVIHGVVTLGSSVQTVSGAIVTLSDGIPNSATTDDLGNFLLSNVPIGKHTIQVLKSGYLVDTAPSAKINFNGESVEAGLIPLFLADGILTGTVRNGDNNPVSDIPITFYRAGPSGSGHMTTTNASGVYRFDSAIVGNLVVKVNVTGTPYYGVLNGTASELQFATSVTSGATTSFNVTLFRVSVENKRGSDASSAPTGWTAQSFKAAHTSLRGVRIGGYLSYSDTTDVEIRADAGGQPNTTVLGTASSGASLGMFSSAITTVVGTTYWLVVKKTLGPGNFSGDYTNNNAYTNGSLMASGDSGGTWTATDTNLDIVFSLLY